MTGPNAISPKLLNNVERLTELAAILAVGAVRLRRLKSSGHSLVAENCSLDFDGDQSGGVEKCSGLETA